MMVGFLRSRSRRVVIALPSHVGENADPVCEGRETMYWIEQPEQPVR